MNRLNKLNHFTSYSVLRKILENGFKFSNPSNWRDKNDAELIKLYLKIESEKSVGVACFMQEDETIYHWMAFSKRKNLKDACCIEFDKEKLLDCLKPPKNFVFQSVQYDTLAEVSFDEPRELLFTKRWPYRNEQEFRIVRLKGRGKIDVKNAIKRITLGPKPDLSYDEFCERRDEIRNIFGIKCDINQSSILENDIWIHKAELLKRKQGGHAVDIKSAKDFTKQEKRNVKNLIEKGGQFEMSNFDDVWNKNPIIAAIYRDSKPIAVGSLNIPLDSHKTTTFRNKAKANLTDSQIEMFQYELDWIVTEPDCRDNSCCFSIVKELLEYSGDKSIYAVVRQHNFTMRKKLEFLDFCVLGEPYVGKGGDKELLYVKNFMR